MIDCASPVFIVGAGRSGTNLLSHVLEQDSRFLNSFENRYIWNYGQKNLICDVRRSSDVNDDIRNYIKKHFDGLTNKSGRIVVDKTPSNVFRIDFLSEVFPKSKIIHILRDGRDNVASRRHEWMGGRLSNDSRSKDYGKTDQRGLIVKRAVHLYEISKRGNVPLDRWPTFLADNIPPFLKQLLGGQATRYGERFPGMKYCLKDRGLLETCAIQWSAGVMHATSLGRSLADSRYIEIRYEDLLSNSKGVFSSIEEFLGIVPCENSHDWLASNVRKANSGRWRIELTENDMCLLERHLRPTLEFLDYEWE